MRVFMHALLTIAVVGIVSPEHTTKGESAKKPTVVKLTKKEMATITAGSSANFPPGQFPSGNPAQAPGQSNPNTVPSSK